MKNVGLCIFLLSLWSCNLEKRIEVPLPPYQSQLMVECYLEAGQPYRLALVESVGYFSLPTLPIVSGAKVQITVNGKTITLDNKLVTDTTIRKSFNYISTERVPADYKNEFTLNISDEQGRTLKAKTTLLPPVRIDTIEAKFRDKDTSAYLLIRFQDNANEKNFYRLTIHKSNIRNNSEQDFNISDRILNGQKVSIGTSYQFKYDQTAIVTLYHISEAWYYFMDTSRDAARANGNPFAQPSSVISNVEGGVGIFTGVSYQRKTFRVK